MRLDREQHLLDRGDIVQDRVGAVPDTVYAGLDMVYAVLDRVYAGLDMVYAVQDRFYAGLDSKYAVLDVLGGLESVKRGPRTEEGSPGACAASLACSDDQLHRHSAGSHVASRPPASTGSRNALAAAVTWSSVVQGSWSSRAVTS